eukprot:CFRG4326T1
MRAREGPVPSTSILKLGVIGVGNFGVVYSGILKDEDTKKESPVAVKELKAKNPDADAIGCIGIDVSRNGSGSGCGSSNESAGDVVDVVITGSAEKNHNRIEEFLLEATLMRRMNHPNVMGCIGIVEGPPVSIILDIMTMGDLRTYLSTQDERESRVTVAERYFFAFQIARGMNYLQRMGVCHRDLATRNCMLSLPSSSTFGFPALKVADFGLSRAVEENNGYYVMSDTGQVPARWTSLEGLLENKFSSASDVWSFGVTMWEIFDNAQNIPYKDMNLFQIVEYLKEGNHLMQPENCPKEAYEMMLHSWKTNPYSRPKFGQLMSDLGVLFLPHCPRQATLKSENGDISVLEGPPEKEKTDGGRFRSLSEFSTQSNYTMCLTTSKSHQDAMPLRMMIPPR